jgi:hypothetical protein
MKEPRRLTEDPSIPAEVRSALAEDEAYVRSFDVDAGLARLSATLEAAPTAAAATSTAWLKVLLISMGIGVAALAVRFALVDEPSSAASSTFAGVATPSSGNEPPTEVTPPPATETDDAPVVPPAEAPAHDEAQTPNGGEPLRATVSSARRSTPRARPEEDPDAREQPAATATAPNPLDAQTLRMEVVLVAAARRALESSPDRALTIVRRADRDIPGGALVEERRAIEVLALNALGRTDEARVAASEFLRRYPRSGLANRVREVLD